MENTENKQSNDAAKADNKTDNQANASANKQQGAAGGENKIAEKVGDILHGDTGAIKDVLSQAKESTGQIASQAYGIAAKRATTAVDEQKANFAQGLTSVADSIRQIGENLRGTEEPTGVAKAAAQYTETAAEKVEQISGYLNKNDLNALLRDVKSLARSNPALFLGGAFTLGILAARFIKSGTSGESSARRGSLSPYAEDGVHLPENLDQQVRNSHNTQVKPMIRKADKSGGTSPSAGSQNKGG
jgi:hypothetical protein